jgi:hypothetical protein
MRKVLLGIGAAIAALIFSAPAEAADWRGPGSSGYYGNTGHGYSNYGYSNYGYQTYRPGHYDYVPGHYDRHRGHYHYVPGHLDYHIGGRRYEVIQNPWGGSYVSPRPHYRD